MRTPRVVVAAVAAVGLALGGCAASGDDQGGVAPTLPESEDADLEAMLDPCTRPNLTTVEPGAVTFATPLAPAPPYFLTDEPADKAGLESALAYALAEQLGFRPAEVTWEIVDASQILTGEFVDYDIALGGFVADVERFPALEFSSPYLTTSVTVVAASADVRDVLVGTAAGAGERVEELRWAGEVQGPGLPWALDRGWLESVDPAQIDRPFRGGSDAAAAAGEVDAWLIDEPTVQWLEEIDGRDLEELSYADAPEAAYSLAMVAGNPLASCVERALGEMSEDGRLAELVAEGLDARAWKP